MAPTKLAFALERLVEMILPEAKFLSAEVSAYLSDLDDGCPPSLEMNHVLTAMIDHVLGGASAIEQSIYSCRSQGHAWVEQHTEDRQEVETAIANLEDYASDLRDHVARLVALRASIQWHTSGVDH